MSRWMIGAILSLVVLEAGSNGIAGRATDGGPQGVDQDSSSGNALKRPGGIAAEARDSTMPVVLSAITPVPRVDSVLG